MRTRSASLATALLLASGGPAAGYTVVLDYRDLETDASVANITRVACSVTAAATGVSIFEDVGIGVWGGLSNSDVDGGEGLAFILPNTPTTALRYYVPAATNVDGDALAGEHFLEGFGPEGDSLGVVPRSGVGTIDATDAFGGASLSSIEITAQADGLRIGRIEYELGPGQEVVIGFDQLASVSAAQIQHCGLTVSSSTGTVGVWHDEGLYAKTGVAGTWTESGEWLEIVFETPVLAEYRFAAVLDDDGDFQEGEHFVEGFDAQGVSLGIRSADGESDPVVLSEPGFFGEEPLSRVVVTAADSFRLSSFTVPEPAGGAPLAAAPALALLSRRRRLH